METKRFRWLYILVFSSWPWSHCGYHPNQSPKPSLKSTARETCITVPQYCSNAEQQKTYKPTIQLLFKISYSGQLFGSATTRNCSHMILCRQTVPFWILHSAEYCETAELIMKVRELAPHPHNYMLLFMVCCSLAMPTYLLYSQQILTTQKSLVPLYGGRLGREVLTGWFISHYYLETCVSFRIYRRDTEQILE